MNISQSFFLCSKFLAARLIGFCLMLLGSAAICHGQSSQGPLTTTYPPIDQFYPFDSFQYDDGTGNDYWWGVGGATLPNGHITNVYQDDNGGTSTVESDPISGTLVSWTITLGNGGGTLSYVDGAPTGHLGSFVQQSGSSALNKVIGINGADYAAQNGNLLVPCTVVTTPQDERSNDLWSFTYGGVTYSRLSDTYDYLWRNIGKYTNGATIINSTADLEQYTEQIEIGLSTGAVAKYIDIGPDGTTYSYRTSSTGGNLLTKINGYSLTATATTVSLPKPVITSFVWNGDLYTFDTVFWTDYGQNYTPRYILSDGYHSNTAQYTPVMSPYVNDDYNAASVNPNGSLANLELTGYGGEASLAGGPINFTESNVLGGSVFTFINNHPYTTIGTPSYSGAQVPVVPLPPVATFNYDNNTYQYTNTVADANNNTFVTQYTGPGGTATMTWSQATNQFVNMTIKPANGGTAKYVNGDAVGRPGAYVLSSSSTLLNKLTQVNSTGFTPSGDAALPSGGYVNSNGVFDVQGNFMSLGQWSNDATHVGFSLSYDDGTPVSTPASIEFTAGRTLTSWMWDAATTDGTGVTPSMQLDQNSRLMLYPPTSTAAGAPAVPTPSVVLDPNPGGVSRFDGPVRISKQGDLSMGEFITEPAQ